MKQLLEKSKYLIYFPVIVCLISALAAFCLGIVRTVITIVDLTSTYQTASYAIIGFIEVMDILLIAITLLMFAIALYELFIGDLDMPEWLVFHHFSELKEKLGNVVILVMAVTFLKYLIIGKNAQEVLFFGIGVASVSIGLKIFAQNDHHA